MNQGNGGSLTINGVEGVGRDQWVSLYYANGTDSFYNPRSALMPCTGDSTWRNTTIRYVLTFDAPLITESVLQCQWWPFRCRWSAKHWRWACHPLSSGKIKSTEWGQLHHILGKPKLYVMNFSMGSKSHCDPSLCRWSWQDYCLHCHMNGSYLTIDGIRARSIGDYLDNVPHRYEYQKIFQLIGAQDIWMSILRIHVTSRKTKRSIVFGARKTKAWTHPLKRNSEPSSLEKN